MKRITLLYFLLLLLLPGTMFWSCSDWTEPEAKEFNEPVPDEYYEALRAYKKSEHQIAFGWFGGWSGEGAYLKSSLIGIPDSVDIVSIWGNWSNLTEMQKADLKFCQEKKGTRFTLCFIITDIGTQITPDYVTENVEENKKEEAIKKFWGWDVSKEEAIRKYARAIVDTINKYNYDGFDIDYEPHYGNPGDIVSYSDNMIAFVDELGKYLGPKSGSGKLLMIDGEPQSLPKELGPYFDYFIVQSYECPGDYDLNNRLLYKGPFQAPNALVKNFKDVMSEKEITNKLVVTENFEAVDVAMNGGYDYTDVKGNKMKSLEGMARWQPENGFMKGGVGTYHMEAEYGTNPEYKNLRRAIQIMNPALTNK